MAHKLDIFKLLRELSSGDLTIWNSLTEEEQKGFAPLVVMRWMSGTQDMAQVAALNEFANRAVFPLAKHPGLLMKVLAACSSRRTSRYQWIGLKKSSKDKLTQKVIRDFFVCSSVEARKLLVPPQDEIIQMAEELGWQKDEMAELKKELKG